MDQSTKRVSRKTFKRPSGLPLFLRWALCIAICVLTMTRAGDIAAHADTGDVAKEERLSCHDAVAMAEASHGIPPGLLQAVAYIESGRIEPSTGRIVAWPWTLNVEGESQYHSSKAEALEALHQLNDRGTTNVDVGCMQINLYHHNGVFTSMEQALDPKSNAQYGARFLRSLYATTGSWFEAVSRYHSATPHLGKAYGARVIAAWQGRGGNPTVFRLPPASSEAGRYARAATIARILRQAGLPVTNEVLYLQMRSNLSPDGNKTSIAGSDDLRSKTDEGPNYSVTAGREGFVNPWASPTNEEDAAATTGSQSRSPSLWNRTGDARAGGSNSRTSRNDRLQGHLPASRFERRRGFMR